MFSMNSTTVCVNILFLQFVTLEAIIAGFLDEFPKLRPNKRIITIATCITLFLCSIICNTEVFVITSNIILFILLNIIYLCFLPICGHAFSVSTSLTNLLYFMYSSSLAKHITSLIFFI